MISSELWRASASDLAQAIRNKTVSSREVVEAHLARIEQVNPRINAFTQVLTEQALCMAEQADALAAKEQWMGSLHGVPFTVKENIDLAGSPTTEWRAGFSSGCPPCRRPAYCSAQSSRRYSAWTHEYARFWDALAYRQ